MVPYYVMVGLLNYKTLNLSKLDMLGLFSHYVYTKTPETSFKHFIGPELKMP